MAHAWQHYSQHGQNAYPPPQGYPQYPQQYSQPIQPGPPQYGYQAGPPQPVPYHPQQPNGYPQPMHSQVYPQIAQHGYHQAGYPQVGFPQGGYSQPYVQPAYQQPMRTPGPQPPLARPSSDGCYNCGNPSHWAQNCPEPRREVPAGAAKEQAGGRPPKRFRPNYIPPVVTKYTVPNHVQVAHQAQRSGSAPSHASPSSAFPGASPLPSQIGPQYPAGALPTPTTAHSPQSAVWQGGSPQHGMSLPPSMPPPAAGPYAPQASPRHSLRILNGGFQQPPAQVTFVRDFKPPHVVIDHQIQQVAQPFATASLQRHLDAQKSGTENSEVKQEPEEGEASPTPTATPPEDDEEESTEDDISKLDIPDLPQDAEAFSNQNPKLIAVPLPSQSRSDAKGTFPAPPPDADGRVQSKFLRTSNLESHMINVRNTEHFEKHRFDPMFQDGLANELAQPSESEPASQSAQVTEDRTGSGTPIPQQEVTGPETYDPFDPAAGLPDEVSRGKPVQYEQVEFDAQNPAPPPPPSWNQDAYNQNAYNQSGYANGYYQAPDQSRPELKRTWEVYEQDSQSGPQRPYAYRNKRGQQHAAEAYSRRW